VDENIKLLSGKRFDDEANTVYRVPGGALPKKRLLIGNESIEMFDYENDEMKKIIIYFIRHHKEHQVPRLQELKRYSESDNNINYREAKKDPYRADNRITSDFANFIVTFKRGVVVGKPIQYTGEGKVTEWIAQFAKRINDHYHNQLMVDDCMTYGRAYEQTYRDEYSEEKVAKLDVQETFVVYDTVIDGPSLFSVRYYSIKILDKTTTTIEIVDKDGIKTVFTCEKEDYDKMKLNMEESGETFFNAVTVTEWYNNEKRMSDFEPMLPNIDAYDLSQSELANFQQDSSDAYLVIEGNPLTGVAADDEGDASEGEEDPMEVLKVMREARMLILGEPTVTSDGKIGPNPKAYYLKKEYDAEGAEKYKDRLVADILRFTFLVDFTDENLGGNNTGIGLQWKGWGTDNNIQTKERLIEKAIMRRFRLLGYSWSLTKNQPYENIYEEINNIGLKFTPNVPKSKTELIEVIQGLEGIVSERTILEMVEALTGVKPDAEEERIKAEKPEDPTRRDYGGEDVEEPDEEVEGGDPEDE